MVRRLQGSIEYIMILAIVIIIALIIVSYIGEFNILDFSIFEKSTVNEITHLMDDVSFSYTINSIGGVQVSAKPLIIDELDFFRLIIKKKW